MTNDTPLLTLSQVRDWEARCVELRLLLTKSTEELDLLTLKIDAARKLIDLLPRDMAFSPSEQPVETAQATPADEQSDESISDVVLSAVVALKGSAKANVVRDWIAKNHPTVSARLDANPAYLYTSLMRHVRGGRLAKRGKSYRIPKLSPAKSVEISAAETQDNE